MERMLKVRDGFPSAVAKDFPKDRVVGHSKASALISINDVNDVDSVGKYGQRVRLKQLQHYCLVGPALDAENTIGAAIEGFDFLVNATVEGGMGLEGDAKIWPIFDPLNVFSVQLQRG